MFNKKQIYILIILILVLVGAVFVFRTKYDRWPWNKSVVLPLPTESTESTISGNESLAAKEPRDIVMEDVAARIGELSPDEPVLGGHWYVLRYWFVDGSYSTLYVEYEDGHIMRRMLLTANLSQMPKVSYKVDAVFEPGESDWILKSGKDQTSTLPLILFEYDSNLKKWVQKN